MRWDLQKIYWTVLDVDATPKGKKKKAPTNLVEYDIKSGKIKILKVGGDGLPPPDHHYTGNGDAVDKDGNLWFANQGIRGGNVLKVDLGIPCKMCASDVFDWGEAPKKHKNEMPDRFGEADE